MSLGTGVKPHGWVVYAFLVLCSVVQVATTLAQPKSRQTSAAVQPPTQNEGPFGYWKHIDDDTGKMDSIFKLWPHEGTLRGKIVKRFPVAGKVPEKLCSECDGKLKDQPIDGMLFLWGFKFDKEENKWLDGKVLNPQDGNVYNCQITLTNNGAVLEVYGFIRLILKIGGTTRWLRPTAKELEGIL